MASNEHHHHAGNGPVQVHLVIVSTSRNSSTDRAGPLLRRLLTESAHEVKGLDILPDDPERLSVLLDDLCNRPDIQAVILSGGTGISARDHTYEVVKNRLDKELPGFGELFRMLSFHEIGPAAMMSRATCGVSDGTLLFALPGSPGACKLAMERLILPEIAHMLYELGKESPLEQHSTSGTSPLAPRGPSFQYPNLLGRERQDSSTAESLSTPPPPGTAPSPRYSSGWKAAIEALGAHMEPSPPVAIPPPLSELAPVRSILEQAGQRAILRFADQGTAGLYGFPDLLRESSRVILVASGRPWGRAIALHRFPQRVGIPVMGDDSFLPDASADTATTSVERTGNPYPGAGELFALDTGMVYVLFDGTVKSWDGHRLRDEGPPASVLSTLLLRWSQR